MDVKTRGRRPGSKNYSQEFREKVVAESYDPSRSIAQVARAYGLNANLVSHWRREQAASSPAAAGTESPFERSPFSRLLPVEVLDPSREAAPMPEPDAEFPIPSCCEIEVESSGRRISVRGISEALAERLLREYFR
jgi:transposase